MIRDFARATLETASENKQALQKCKHMAVVQHHPEASLTEWMWAYDQLGDNFCDWIAFPRILGARRVELIAGLQKLGKWWVGHHHHAFGMNAGSLSELPKLNSLGVDSCDSSAPVWRGLMGYSIFDGTWPDIPFDPHYHHIWGATGRDSTELMQLSQLADRNLAEVLEACQQKWEMPSHIKAETI